MTIQIGNVTLKKTAMLAPLAGVADRAFREVCRDPGQKAFLEGLRHYAAAPRGPLGDPGLVKQLYGGQIRLTATRLDRVSTCRMEP